MKLLRAWSGGISLRSALVALAAVAAPAAVYGQGATVSGHVTAAGTNAPLQDSRVMVVGTSIMVSTNAEGAYTIRNLPAGTVEIRSIHVGYTEQKKPIAVTANGSMTVDFSMAPMVIQLQEIVTTATGAQRQVELGNAVSTIDAAKAVQNSPVSTIADLLTGKSPGVIIDPPNMTGSAPVIRIRGVASLSLSNAPIVMVDGVRYFSSATAIGDRGLGGTQTSFFDTISPEEIEDIEIVKGPSAATLYGTDAANGVILVTTKKGRAGATQWNWFADANAIDDRNTYPSTYALWGHTPAGVTQRCELPTMSATTCIPDSTTSINIAQSGANSPLQIGNNRNYGGQVSGGSDAVRYFISSDLFNEVGAYHMPQFAQQWLVDTAKAPLNDSWVNPEAYQRENIRANISAALSPKFDLNVNAGFAKSDQRAPQVDNNINGIGGAMFLTYGTNHAGLDYNPVGALGEDLHGYARFTPASIFQFVSNTGIQRISGSADAQWRPFSWMQNQGTVGIDLADQAYFDLCQFGQCPAFSTNRAGFVDDEHDNNRAFSVKLISNSSWNARTWANLKTTFGADYLNNESDFSAADGTTLPPGAQTVGSTSNKSASDGQESATKTLGVYVQEQAGLRDRVFITGAVRSDQNSAFGTNFQRVFYPKVSLSWIMSDESFFPKFDWLNQFRLRSAYGESGVQPGATSSLRRFSAGSVSLSNTDTPSLLESALGNPNLKPETSGELEAGFESRVLNNRVNVDFTYYNKKTTNALVSLPIAPSAAPSATSVLTNLASTNNSGFEATINASLIDTRRFGWDVVLTGSHNSNRINSLGKQPNGKPVATIAVFTDRSVRDSSALPIDGLYLRPFTFKDANGDGIIQTSEVTVDTGFVYRGYTVPRDIVSLQNGFDLFNRKVRLSAQLDYKGGFNVEDGSMQFICNNAPQSCVEQQVATTSLARQARSVAENFGTTVNGTKFTTVGGYWETGQFWRLREVSASIQLPQTLVSRLRARDASIVFSGRNLHWWGSYTGADPEENFSTGDIQDDFITTAPRTYFEFRLNLHY